jgi:hypothetical protein
MAGRQTKLDINDDRVVMLATILEIVDEVPDELLTVSVPLRAQLHAAVQDLRHTIELMKGQDARSRLAHGFPQWPIMQWLGEPPTVAGRFATEVIRDILTQCPDEITQAGTQDLLFVSDQQFRDSLRLDISSVNMALVAGQYKSATVLGGSIVEALLLWGLSRKTPADRQNFISTARSGGLLVGQPHANLEQWDLHTYIEVAISGSLIRPDTAAIARIAKNFRNLVHPGRSQRLGQVCDRGTALAVASAMEHVITDFTKTPP